MNYEETVNFIKLFLLLMNGGTFLLRTLIYKLISESGKSLDDLLLQSRYLFDMELKKNRKQFDLLFPGSSQKADIEQWDISLLTFVLLNVFKGFFDCSEIISIKVIRDHRNKILAHNANSEMTLKDFMSAWNQVSCALTHLSVTVTPKDQKELKCIESSIFQDPFQKKIVGQLKEMGQTDTLVQAVIEKFMPLVKKTILESEKKTQEQIDKCIEQLTIVQEEQKKQSDRIDILARMEVNTNSIRSRQQVQEHIIKASNSIIQEGSDVDSSNDEVLSTVGNLFKGMENQGVKVVKADIGSILFTLLCPTIRSLRDVTLYLESPEILERLSDIENAVEKCHCCVAKITIDVDLKSLQFATKKAGKGSVYLTLECRGENGLRNAFRLFENDDSPNTVDKLSEALARKVGTKVELQTGIDIDKKDTLEKENIIYRRQHNQDEKRKDVGKREAEEKRLREEERKTEEERKKWKDEGERRQKREEDERKKQEEERRRKLEEMRQRDEEKRKREKEKTRQDEERRNLEEEMRQRNEEKRKREAEEKRLREEERKTEEERKKWKDEGERRRKREEDERKKQQEERRRKLEEMRQRDEEKRKREKEKTRQDEERRNLEEEMRQRNEEKRKREKEKHRQDEARRKLEEYERGTSVPTKMCVLGVCAGIGIGIGMMVGPPLGAAVGMAVGAISVMTLLNQPVFDVRGEYEEQKEEERRKREAAERGTRKEE